MNRGIIVVLLLIAALGGGALYVLQQGPSLFMSGPPQERIAYISTESGRPDLWTMLTDGSDKRRISSDEADDRAPEWSPDGSEIATVSDRHENAYQVFLSAWNGKYTHQITIGAGTKDLPVWTSDGKTLAYISSGRVFATGARGGEEEQILPPMQQGNIDEMPPFSYVASSPSRPSLAVILDVDQTEILSVLEDIHGAPIQITKAHRIGVSWAPTGSRLAVSFMGRRGQSGILIADTERMSAEDIWAVKDESQGPMSPAWSPDGKTIAFEMWAVKGGMPDKCLGIYTVSADGGAPRRIVEGDAREPSWSPDSKSLACTLARPDGGRDIWRIGVDGSGTSNLTNGKGDNYSPSWSPRVRK